MAKFSDILFGKKPKLKTTSTLSADQQELMKLIQEGVKGGGQFADLFGGFNKDQFEKGVTQPALQNFKDNILPMIQEKFVAGNQVGGSGMQRSQLKAGTDLQSQLAQLMYQAQQGQKQNQAAGLQTALQPHQQQLYQPGTQGVIPSLLSSVAPAIGLGGGSGLQGLLQSLLQRPRSPTGGGIAGNPFGNQQGSFGNQGNAGVIAG